MKRHIWNEDAIKIFESFTESFLVFNWQLHLHEGTKYLELSHKTEENTTARL